MATTRAAVKAGAKPCRRAPRRQGATDAARHVPLVVNLHVLSHRAPCDAVRITATAYTVL